MGELTKAQAIAALKRLGYTVEYMPPGESGDSGPGSRLYYKKPNAPVNEFGMPLSDYANASKFGRFGWVISEFAEG